MDAFLETYKLPRLKQEEIDFLNRPINYEEIETVIKKKVSKKQNSRPKRFSWVITPNIQRRNNTYFPEAVSRNRNRRKTSKLLMQGQHYPDPKTRQKPHQNGEIETNIPDEHGCQNTQQDPG